MTDPIPHPAVSTTAIPLTSLAEALGASSIPLLDYRGALTAATFSNPGKELAALHSHAGVYDLGWKSFLRCAGRDRVRWLNGMVTNSVKDLADNAACYAFVLNAQGRIQGDLLISRRASDPDALWLQTDRAQLDTLIGFVRRYIIMDQVTLDPAQNWTALGVAGPEALDKLAAIGLQASEPSSSRVTEARWNGHPVVVLSAHSPLVPRYQIWVESPVALDLWNVLIAAGALPCGATAVEHLRILEGTPAYGVDIADRDLPQETGQMHALHFNKGCYLGQEIVERIHSRGSVHRVFSGFLLEDDRPASKTPIAAGDKSVGDVTSVARIYIPEVGERILALGFVRREALEAAQSLSANGTGAKPRALPFHFTDSTVQS